MHIGYLVGIIVAIAVIISGCVAAIYTRKRQRKSKWAMWAIILGIAALISAAINFNLFNG